MTSAKLVEGAYYAMDRSSPIDVVSVEMGCHHWGCSAEKAKAAQVALVRYLAKELGPQGINVNAVCAGLVDTEALAQYPDRKLLLRWVRLRTPMRRLTTTEDVAKSVVFLCSPQSDMLQGHTLVVDGGLAI